MEGNVYFIQPGGVHGLWPAVPCSGTGLAIEPRIAQSHPGMIGTIRTAVMGVSSTVLRT